VPGGVLCGGGRWTGLAPGDVPATRLLDRGIWYRVRGGVRGVLLLDGQGRERAYAVCEPASHYYRVMTRSDGMPLLIGERV
jgi:hypothetical protein